MKIYLVGINFFGIIYKARRTIYWTQFGSDFLIVNASSKPPPIQVNNWEKLYGLLTMNLAMDKEF